MKNIIFFIIVFAFVANDAFSQDSSGNLYLQALSLDIHELSSSKSDTLIAQKEDYFPEILPQIIGGKTVIYLTSDAIENYHGNKVGMRKVFPIEIVNNVILQIEIGYFSYYPVSGFWIRSGGCYYRFRYDCQKQQIVFIEREEYGM
jgi:hypothetical protein